MKDNFLNKTHCDRCKNILKVRIMSWFTEETICMECSEKESDIKNKLKKQGKDARGYEGCGYIPILK